MPLLTSPPASAGSPNRYPHDGQRPFFGLFPFFSVLQKTVKKRPVQKHFFWPILAIFGSADVDFRPFLVPKRVSGASFFGVFSKTVILRKSCSRCGGSVVFQGRTLPKSVPRPTPNRDGEKNRRKSPPAPSPDPLFRSRARFWSISGPRPDPQMAPKSAPAKNTTSGAVSVF